MLGIFVGLIALAGTVRANTPVPIMFEPGDWLGDDGNWSTSQFSVGSEGQAVHLLTSTSLSEIWAIDQGGCFKGDPRCSSARGGLFSPQSSSKWFSLGAWQLSLPWLSSGAVEANGEYGLDSLAFFSPYNNMAVTMPSVLMAAINTTSFYDGYFGLGLAAWNTSNQIVNSPVVQAVDTFKLVPSHSYGYTAGAWYRNSPSSVTLGGFDAHRFDENGVPFTIDPSGLATKALVRGIHTQLASPSDVTASNSSGQPISGWKDRFVATIDSTTPFLWLPAKVCDRFADALGLKYDNKYELYTLSDKQYSSFSDINSLNFTFSLSSYDDSSNFGHPLRGEGVVNITVPIAALVSKLQYPYQNESIAYGDDPVPYLSLKKSSSEDSAILGRSFLQEAYVVVRYDDGQFSVYQAKFPSGQPDIAAIEGSSGSPVGASSSSGKGSSLSTGVKVGIAVGVAATVVSTFAIFLWFCCRRRSRVVARSSLRLRSSSEHNTDSTAPEMEEQKETSTLASQEPPRTIKRIFTIISPGRISRRVHIKGKGGKKGQQVGVSGSAAQPVEAPVSEIYELPVPDPPVELDVSEEDSMYDLPDSVERSGGTLDHSTYEVIRRRLDRQLQGPVPEYTPPMDRTNILSEKTGQHPGLPLAVFDPSETPGQRTIEGEDTGSLPQFLPSPISPRDNEFHNSFEGVSSVTSSEPNFATRCLTIHAADPSQSSEPRDDDISRSQSDSDPSMSPISPSSLSLPLPMTVPVQRTPIDPSKVVLLGRLPDHFRPSGFQNLPHIIELSPPTPTLDITHGSGNLSQSSLGSNFTEEEQERIGQISRVANRERKLTGHAVKSDRNPAGLTTSSTFSQRISSYPDGKTDCDESANSISKAQTSQGRVDPSLDLIHVPQMAHRRYSWEDGI